MIAAIIIFGLIITVLLIRISNQLFTINESIVNFNNNYAMYVVKKAQGQKPQGWVEE